MHRPNHSLHHQDYQGTSHRNPWGSFVDAWHVALAVIAVVEVVVVVVVAVAAVVAAVTVAAAVVAVVVAVAAASVSAASGSAFVIGFATSLLEHDASPVAAEFVGANVSIHSVDSGTVMPVSKIDWKNQSQTQLDDCSHVQWRDLSYPAHRWMLQGSANSYSTRSAKPAHQRYCITTATISRQDLPKQHQSG